MPTRITQFDDAERSAAVLRVEGSLTVEDAGIIEGVVRELRERGARAITLDLGELDFLDSDSASMLCRLRHDYGVALEGLHLFVQQAIEMAERAT